MKTIAFFDMFDYPLTAIEIFKYSGLKSSLLAITNELDLGSGGLDKIIEEKNGFYFLRGRGRIMDIKMKRYNIADKKFRRALLVAKIFRFIPWIKMIAVSNIIGAHNMKKEGDIDFFIITDKKRIWITRFFCAGSMSLAYADLSGESSGERQSRRLTLNIILQLIRLQGAGEAVNAF